MSGSFALEQRHQRLVAGHARLTARQPDLHHAPRAKQRHVARRGAHVIPVGAALEKVRFALGEPGRPRPRAHRVGGLASQQWLVAGNEIDGQQVLLEMGRQGVGIELHGKYRNAVQPTR